MICTGTNTAPRRSGCASVQALPAGGRMGWSSGEAESCPAPTLCISNFSGRIRRGELRQQQQLAAIRHLFDWLVIGQIVPLNPAASVRGPRPALTRDDRHESAWLFGSVCAQRAVGAGLVMPWVGGEAMSLHLDAVSQVVAPGAHAVLLRDGAGWPPRSPTTSLLGALVA